MQLNYSMVFWDKVYREVSAAYPGMTASQMHIDALSGYFIMHPDRLQVVVASNLSETPDGSGVGDARQYRHIAFRESQPGGQVPEHVRADSRFRA